MAERPGSYSTVPTTPTGAMDSSMEARDSMTTEASPLHSTASSSGGGGGGKARVLSLGTAVMAISVAAVAALGL